MWRWLFKIKSQRNCGIIDIQFQSPHWPKVHGLIGFTDIESWAGHCVTEILPYSSPRGLGFQVEATQSAEKWMICCTIQLYYPSIFSATAIFVPAVKTQEKALINFQSTWTPDELTYFPVWMRSHTWTRSIERSVEASLPEIDAQLPGCLNHNVHKKCLKLYQILSAMVAMHWRKSYRVLSLLIFVWCCIATTIIGVQHKWVSCVIKILLKKGLYNFDSFKRNECRTRTSLHSTANLLELYS